MKKVKNINPDAWEVYMSHKNPVIAVTGSSGAGTTSVKSAFERIFMRENYIPCVIEGDSFHRFDRCEMQVEADKAFKESKNFSHFGPEANLFEKLEKEFKRYADTGYCEIRKYLHSNEEAIPYGKKPGTFTSWEKFSEKTDFLFYEGLHGGIVDEQVNIAGQVDLLIGVVPVVNLEWIQKIHRDIAERGYQPDVVTNTILRRMYDYVHYITPQFSRTDVNFQRVPTVDTSNPFIARDIPSQDESFVVIRFSNPAKFKIDFVYLQGMIKGSFMSRRNSIVIPGGKMELAYELIFGPIIENIVAKSRELKDEMEVEEPIYQTMHMV